jgi:hypothetical protein
MADGSAQPATYVEPRGASATAEQVSARCYGQMIARRWPTRPFGLCRRKIIAFSETVDSLLSTSQRLLTRNSRNSQDMRILVAEDDSILRKLEQVSADLNREGILR